MTLYRQLLATMLLLFGLLFAATYWVQFNSTRNYLAQQQETTVINTSTALGLALTLSGERRQGQCRIRDQGGVRRGYYKLVRLDLLASRMSSSWRTAAISKGPHSGSLGWICSLKWPMNRF